MNPDKRKRFKKAVSLLAALAMLSSTIGTAAAAEPGIAVPDSNPVSGAAVSYAAPLSDDAAAPEETAAYGRAAGVPTAQEAYNAMIALKEKYPEGMTWTNFEPYGSKGELDSEYTWQGGSILGNVNSGVGCAAFAFLLSDTAFGSLPARELYDVSLDNVNVGDILRVNNNSHSVIVLQKSAAGVTVAEGNYNKTVHWGRVMSKAEVKDADFIVTRYPKGSAPSDNPGAGETVVHSGSDGDDLHWALTSAGTLTVSGGAIRNYSQSGDVPPWNTHNDSINAVIIEDGITSIGDNAFYQSPALSVFIPKSVTSIGQSAFSKSSLIDVTIPGSVAHIGDDAFRACTNLTSATVSEGVKTIGERSFTSCTALQYIDFPASITSVGAGAFTECTEMTRVRFKPGSETVAIGDNLFTECRNLTDVTLPEKADCISDGMFLNCKSLDKLYIPAGIAEIKGLGIGGRSPFDGCISLTEINFAGDEATWRDIGGTSAMDDSTSNVKVNFNVPFPDPFIEDPIDHVHNWSSADWNHDENYHWHECSAADCPVTSSSEKDGYAAHTYGSWVTDASATSNQSGSRHRDCTVCAYRQTDSIPATGSSSSGSSGGSNSSGGSWSSGSSGNYGGSWGSGNYGGSSGSSNNSGSTNNPAAPDSSDNSTGETGQSPGSSDSNTTDSPSNDANGSNEPDNSNGSDSSDTANSSSSNLKQLKTKFNKQLKSSLKSQLKAQLKTKLKKKLKAASKQPSKAKLKKQLKAALKQKLKATLKKQLKKQFGTELGDQFVDLFNKQFNALFNEVYNEQFNTLYKQLKKS